MFTPKAKSQIIKILKIMQKSTEGKVDSLLLVRDTITSSYILGKLYLSSEFIAHTLELPDLDNKKNVSCIPTGKYICKKRYRNESASYNYIHLILEDVPNRDYILFHRGNTTKDTSGCVLVGEYRDKDKVLNSKKAMDYLMAKILETEEDKIELTIKNKYDG